MRPKIETVSKIIDHLRSISHMTANMKLVDIKRSIEAAGLGDLQGETIKKYITAAGVPGPKAPVKTGRPNRIKKTLALLAKGILASMYSDRSFTEEDLAELEKLAKGGEQ